MLIKVLDRCNAEILNALVLLHTDAFPGFFLTSLGDRFLRLLYTSYLESKSCACIIAYKENEVASDICASIIVINNPSAFYRLLLKKKWSSFLYASLFGAMNQPLLLVKKLYSALFYRGDADTKFDVTNGALIASIAVSPSAQGWGVGKKLLKEAEQWAEQQGLWFAYLTTDRDNNKAVNDFYQKCGYRLDSTIEKSGGRIMARYVKKWTI